MTSIIWPGTKQPEEDEVGNLKFNRILFMKRVYECLPVRTCSIHFGIPDTQFYQVFRTLFVLTMPQFLRRMKFHVGKIIYTNCFLCDYLLRQEIDTEFHYPNNHHQSIDFEYHYQCEGENIERLYSIKGYGVPVELIPLTDTGNIKTAYLKQWMKLRKVVETMQMTAEGRQNAVSIIECPGSNDVVFRSGTSMSYHPGNVRFRCLVESKFEIPENISQMTQAELAEQLIKEIQDCGGRFLKWDNRGYWLELQDRLQIHTKVALAIRDFKYKTKVQRNRQTNQSYTHLFENQDGNKRKRTDEDPRSSTKTSTCRTSWL